MKNLKPGRWDGWFILAGVVLAALGAAHAFILYRWSGLNQGLSLGGLIFSLAALRRLRLNRPAPDPAARKNRGLIMMTLAGWFVLLVVVNYAGYRNNIRRDITEKKTHTLSEATQEFVRSLGEPLKMTAFYVGVPPKYLEDLLAEYRRISGGLISAEIIDPLVDLGYAAQFGNTISGDERRLIIQTRTGERRDVNFTRDVLTENDINNAILQLTRPARLACFLGGHGEADPFSDKNDGFDAFTKHLMANNIVVKRLNLGADDGVPDDCDVLVIAGPFEPLREAEVDEIQAYLKRGGRALVLVEGVILASPDAPLRPDQAGKNPSLNEVLNEWGVKVNDDVVVDLSSHASGDVGSPATKNYMTHRAIVGELDYTFFIRPRSVSMIKERRKTIKLAPLILTGSAESSWGETNRNLQVKYDQDADRPGPVPFAFVIYEPREGDDAPGTRIVLITDRDFLSNAYIGYYSNARLGLNAINWLTEKDYRVFVHEDETAVPRITLNSRQKREVLVVLLLAPLGILIFSLLRFVRGS
jgi:ABC-type uncharacterized transport system involved in gliding motility auxiliary subunit